ncbi:hypothetical protein EV193_11633 [Herbihabitans rhizosphaerae]|uniref:Uncharacterized protein n=1 Tax=Herbihabitans rhizosphaerae TaxID=1872711 RepID=A0A4Q7KCR7_9PSEU|nr:hypothetical protein EV193_11633 [Herbihabitans rhizosphaerae]
MTDKDQLDVSTDNKPHADDDVVRAWARLTVTRLEQVSHAVNDLTERARVYEGS